ncbi:hypothetical protein [Caminibacter pacificus]|uniref:Uncharacterized protein n=1 Tax=Caminibacter pacificus TaxID=1424653 RepID=A0AAJ4RB30_9BACT|nr:hypothetical protein [Caminibacter pacificus]QDD68209.1 hypothetical protein C6V80_10160 [Caminibacter pacificus]ROR38721.1 hypothetical protein EDC58_1936 [Caminibacter pacificus]
MNDVVLMSGFMSIISISTLFFLFALSYVSYVIISKALKRRSLKKKISLIKKGYEIETFDKDGYPVIIKKKESEERFLF